MRATALDAVKADPVGTRQDGGRYGPAPGPARGEAARQLRPLAEALGAAPYPRSVLSWLHRHSAAALLTGLAAEGQALTHEMLDGMPWMKSTR
ncbi:hypothetical protein [Streptomyces sp. NPDC094466]|uniref:hypothetical protein n=1 Tax=Streptomyces sp. NPDC094466 TaxID=3366065 RepID=UPI003810BD12